MGGNYLWRRYGFLPFFPIIWSFKKQEIECYHLGMDDFDQLRRYCLWVLGITEKFTTRLPRGLVFTIADSQRLGAPIALWWKVMKKLEFGKKMSLLVEVWLGSGQSNRHGAKKRIGKCRGRDKKRPIIRSTLFPRLPHSRYRIIPSGSN